MSEEQMSNKELLELAAKAAVFHAPHKKNWNLLTDDGAEIGKGMK